MSDENTMDPNAGVTPAQDQNEQSTPAVTPDTTPTGEGEAPTTEEPATPAM